MRIFAILSVIVGVTSISAADDLAVVGRQVLGEMVSSRTLEYENLQSFDVLGDRVVVRTWDSLSEKMSVKVLDALTQEELWSVDKIGRWSYCPLQTGHQCPIVLREYYAEGKAVWEVYNLDGRLLFSGKWTINNLAAVPGTFIYTERPGEFDRGELWVMSFEGVRKRMTAIPEPLWTAGAFNDSLLLVWTPQSRQLKLVSVPHDSVVASVGGLPFDGSADPNIFVGRSGDQAVLTWIKTAVCVDRDLKVRWQRDEVVLDLVFSPDGAFIAVLEPVEYVAGTGAIQTISLLRSSDGAEVWTVSDTASGFGQGSTSIHHMTFESGLLRLTIPYSLSSIRRSDVPGMKTWLFSMNAETCELQEHVEIDGKVDFTTIGDEIVTFSVTLQAPNSLIVTKWRTTNKTD